MRTFFFVLPVVLLMAGCFTRPPQHQEESYLEQSRRQQREDADKAKAYDIRIALERTNYVTIHAELKPAIQEAILNGRVIIGMTAEQAWKSLGSKGRFEHSVETVGGRIEEWKFQYLQLMFANGVLIEIVQ